jgi:hypothetical protein
VATVEQAPCDLGGLPALEKDMLAHFVGDETP